MMDKVRMDKTSKIVATRNVQADILENIRKLLFDARVIENWLDEPDEELCKKLDTAALACYEAYHYIGSTRPDRVSLRKRQAENGQSKSSE